MQITWQEHTAEDGEPVLAPVIPPTATVDEIEVIVAIEGAGVMTDEQAARIEQHFSEGVTRDGISR
ncbi:MAG: hypothetical protein OXK78_10810 [Caldilineaceae bacterium]|nr:hypothetical protein [Caldilineaceae bacterium]